MQRISSYTTTPSAIASLSGEQKFVKLSEPADYHHKSTTDLTTQNNTFDTIDISGTVPAGATSVLFLMVLKDTAADSRMHVRDASDTDIYRMAEVRTMVANVLIKAIGWCSHDGSQTLAYRINEAVTYAYITILGYWI